MLATMTCTVSALCRQKAVHTDGGRGREGSRRAPLEQAIPEMKLEGRAERNGQQAEEGWLLCADKTASGGKRSRARRMIQYARNDRQFPVLSESIERGKSPKATKRGQNDSGQAPKDSESDM